MWPPNRSSVALIHGSDSDGDSTMNRYRAQTWIEVHTFTPRNGPELNGASADELPDGQYVHEAEVESLHQQLRGAVDLLRELCDQVDHDARFGQTQDLARVAGRARAFLAMQRGQ